MGIYIGKTRAELFVPVITKYEELNIHFHLTEAPTDLTKLWVKRAVPTKTFTNTTDTLLATEINITTSSDNENGKLVKLINTSAFVYETYVSDVLDNTATSIDSLYYNTVSEEWEAI